MNFWFPSSLFPIFWNSSSPVRLLLAVNIYLLICVVVGTNHAFAVLSDMILDDLPTKPDDFESSTASRLLDRFSLALLFLPYQSTSNTPLWLTEHRRSVELGRSLLSAIARLPLAKEAVNDGETSPSSPTTRRPQRSQWQQSRKDSRASARPVRSPVVDSKPFTDYGVEVPTSAEEAVQLCSTVLGQQKVILQVRDILDHTDSGTFLRCMRRTTSTPSVRNVMRPPSKRPISLPKLCKSKTAIPKSLLQARRCQQQLILIQATSQLRTLECSR